MQAVKRNNKIQSRSAVNCPIFGSPQELKSNQLPTYNDIIRYYLWVRKELKLTMEFTDPSVIQISKRVATDIQKIWKRASIPTVTYRRIWDNIRSYYERHRNLMKSYKKLQNSSNFKLKIENLKDTSTKLFDICSCKCENITKCTCEKSRRVPKKEWDFLIDQRTARKMIIASIDQLTTKKELNKEKRNLGRNSSSQACFSTSQKQQPGSQTDSLLSSDIMEFDLSQPVSCQSLKGNSISPNPNHPHKIMSLECTQPAAKQMRIALPCLALACDRTGVSDRSAAIIASAVLQDIGLITSDDKTSVVDRSKIRRAREKKRQQLMDEEETNIIGLYFDGRKDKTISMSKKGKKYHRTVVIEEHYVLVSEPNSTYFGHTTCDSGSAANIKESLINYLNVKSVDLSQISVVGCDGTAVNTGPKGGIVRLLEVELKKPLQWFICQIHANELPLRHLILHLDGDTAGPGAFSGPIGKQLKNCENLPIVQFEVIKTTLPELNINGDLSTSQQYLLDIMTAISTGHCSSDLSNRSPGALNHSRWLTAANRILRLYVTLEEPTENLKILATFVMKVYGPMWFTIKCNPSCTKGAQHLWLCTKLIRYLDNDLKSIIKPVIQRNGYFAHTENILLSMLADNRQSIRQIAYLRILKARSETTPDIRKFSVPKINFEAPEYIDLVNWQTSHVTEPPLTANWSEEKLKEIVETGIDPEEDIIKFPCHTQAVERCIKLVTQASELVCGEKARDGFIRARIQSRNSMPSFATKSQFVT